MPLSGGWADVVSEAAAAKKATGKMRVMVVNLDIKVVKRSAFIKPGRGGANSYKDFRDLSLLFQDANRARAGCTRLGCFGLGVGLAALAEKPGNHYGHHI